MVPVQVLHETALVTVGIAYLHLPALGNPGGPRWLSSRPGSGPSEWRCSVSSVTQAAATGSW